MGSFYTDWVDEKYLHSISFSILEYLEMKKKKKNRQAENFKLKMR